MLLTKQAISFSEKSPCSLRLLSTQIDLHTILLLSQYVRAIYQLFRYFDSKYLVILEVNLSFKASTP